MTDEERCRDALGQVEHRFAMDCGASTLVCNMFAAAVHLVLTTGMTFDEAFKQITGPDDPPDDGEAL